MFLQANSQSPYPIFPGRRHFVTPFQIAPVGTFAPTFSFRSDLRYVPTLRMFLRYKCFYSECWEPRLRFDLLAECVLSPGYFLAISRDFSPRFPGFLPAISRDSSPQFLGVFPAISGNFFPRFPGIFPRDFQGFFPAITGDFPRDIRGFSQAISQDFSRRFERGKMTK